MAIKVIIAKYYESRFLLVVSSSGGCLRERASVRVQ